MEFKNITLEIPFFKTTFLAKNMALIKTNCKIKTHGVVSYLVVNYC